MLAAIALIVKVDTSVLFTACLVLVELCLGLIALFDTDVRPSNDVVSNSENAPLADVTTIVACYMRTATGRIRVGNFLPTCTFVG